MRTILVVGVGYGDPESLTVAAAAALASVQVVLLLDKGDRASELRDLRLAICARHIPGPYRVVEVADPERDRTGADRPGPEYFAAVEDWRRRRVLALEAGLREVPADGTAAMLVIGDPGLYDGTIDVLDQLLERGRVPFRYRVLPGVTAMAALTAAHGITLNRIGEPVRIVTGRMLANDPVVAVDETVVVMLDGGRAWRRLESGDMWIWWGANLGTPRQRLVAGRLVEVIGELEAAREAVRAEAGWVLDTYLLRRRL